MFVALRSILPAVMLACLGAGQTAAQPICKPALTVKQVGFSEMINLRRIWTASVDVDASRCTTTSGLYSIRLQERMIASPNSHALADRVPTYQEKRKDVQKSK